MALLETAKAAAEADGKVVLVAMGAEWCVWCHSFFQTVHGMTGDTTVYHEGEAYEMGELPASRPEISDELEEFVAATFVLVSIETQYSPDWTEVLASTGAPDPTTVPYVFSLKDGQFVAQLRWEEDLPGIEKSSDFAPFYRGFDRQMLLSELQRMAAAAQ